MRITRSSTFPKAWRTITRKAPRPWPRLLLERLEDRVVPSITDGTILVTTRPSSFSTQDQSGFPTGIIGVNPTTGAQTVVSTGGLFSLPTYVTEAPNQQLYVTDLTAFGTGAVLRVDPNTGQQFLVAKGGMINGPNVLTFLNGFLYVANVGDSSGTVHTIVRVDPNTGQQTLVTNGSGGGFSISVGMVPAPGNNVYLADEPGNFMGSAPGKIWEINLDTGVQTIISSNNATQGTLFDHPVDVTTDANGTIFVANTGGAATNVAGSIFRIDPKTGVQTLITQFGPYSGTDSLEVGLNGMIFVGAIAAGSNPGALVAVNPTTGAQTTLSSGGSLSLVEGIRAFRATVQTTATVTTVSSSANPSVFGQNVAFTATISPNPASAAVPTGTVQFIIDGANAGSPVNISATGGVATATMSIASLAVGTHTVTASYSGDPSFATSSGSLGGGQTVSKANTSVAVTSSVNPSVFGQAVNFTATIGVTAPGAGVPTGTVQFQIDGANAGSPVNVSTSGGTTTASFSTAGLAVGTHTITASYGGNASFLASTGTLTGGQTVGKASTSTTVSSSANPSLSGQTVTLTTTITPTAPGAGTPTGTVQFVIDGSNAGSPVTVSTSGGATTATFSSAALAVGTHTVAASYSGDGSFAGSSGTLSGGQVVNKPAPVVTTTTVSSSANPSVFGQSAVFTATVSVPGPGGGTPTGTVQFVVDGSPAGSPVGLSSSGGVSTASFSTAGLAVGTHTVAASYGGDGNFAGSSGTLSGGQTVGKAATSTAVTASANPSVSGQNVSFTATVTPTAPGAGTPTGTVQFVVDGSNAGSPVNLTTSGGVTTASFSTAGLAVGTHTVSATYSGDSNFSNSAGSLTGGQTVAKAGTSTSVTSSVNPSVSGQNVSFTATVTPTAPGAGTPTGAVQFVIDGSNAGSPVNVSTSGGVITASFSTAGLAVGTHTVTASYSGDSNFAASSRTLSGGQAVNNKAATTTVVSASANPAVFGQSVVFTATVSGQGPGGATPVGTVQFQVDGTNAGSPVNMNTTGGVSTATFSTAGLAVGTHTITASYSGDANFAGSTGTLSAGQTVAKANTSTAVSASVNPSVFGQNVTFTATVSVAAPGGGTPTGTVQFMIDGSNSGSPVSVASFGGVTTATFSTSSLSVGTHTVTASYGGDGNFAASIGALSGAETVNKASTSTAVTASANPSLSGQTVTFTATITATAPGAGTPTGTVQFVIDGSNAGSPATVTTSGGVTTASFSTASLAIGTHTVAASYGGDGSFAGSSGTLSGGQVVNKPAPVATATAVSSSANPSVFGQGVVFTATVSVAGPGGGTPTGTVQFVVDGSPAGSPVGLSGGGVATASFSAAGLAVGTHTVAASYGGDGNFAGSSGTLSGGQTVGKAGTSTAVTASASPSVAGQNVAFTATVTPTAPGAGTPTGTVQFVVDGSNAGSPVTLSTTGGVSRASFSAANLSVGTHTITASYSGDASFAGSSTPFLQTVGKAPTSTAVTSSVNPALSGQTVTFMATLSGVSTPTGTVQFVIDGSNAGSPVSVSTNGGVTTATFSSAALAVGTHTVAASYSGDDNLAASTGTLNGGEVVINKPATTTVVSASANPAVFGQTVVFTAAVSLQSAGSGTPTGTVQFLIDGTTVGNPVTVSTSSGVVTANFSTASLAVGTHTVTASYSGDASFAGSTGSLAGGLTVAKASTSTALTSSVDSPVFGQSVTFTATVNVAAPGAGTPTGTVQFVIDGSNAGSPVAVATSGGVTTASFSTSSLTVHGHTVSASYSGDSNFAASTGTLSGGETVDKAGTSTTVTSSADPSVSGQSVTFTATVSVNAPGAGTPVGTVQFVIDGSNAGSPVTVATSGGVTTASFSTSSLAVGMHTVAASYSGAASFAGSSGTLSGGQVVNNPVTTATTTAVSSSANPSVFGQNVVFTAVVSVPSPGSGTPTGTVQFVVDGSPAGSPVAVATSGGVTSASFSTASLAVGTHTVTATYSGDSSFASSTATLSGGQTVGQAATSTVVTSSASPSVFGQNTTFTATVSVTSPGAGLPTGTVQFAIDGASAGNPVSVSTFGGVTTATFSAAGLAVGSHSVTASYSGDSSFAASTGTLSGGQTVNKASTAITLAPSANPSVSGQNFTVTATISVPAPGGGTPTGTIQWIVDGTNAGSPVNVSTSGGVTTASFSTASLTVGTHTITASYSGDASFAGSSSTPLTQTVGKASTSTAVASSMSPSAFGQSVTFTAVITVTAPGVGAPTGTVQFLIDGNSAGSPVSVSSSGGAATANFSTNSLSVGTHTITASYSGDGNVSASTSAALTQIVGKTSTSTVLVSSANPSTPGQAVTFTATVTAGGLGSGTPTGAVQFAIDGTSAGSPVNVSTTGSVTTASFIATLGAGTHTVSATYSGDSSFASSVATPLTQTVSSGAAASTTTTVTSSANPQTAGQPVSWTATVAAAGAVNLVNFETGDFSQAATRTGGAIVTSPALDGAFSLQLQRANSVANYEIRQSGTTYYNLPTAYYSMLFEYTANPGEGGIVNFQDTASGYKAALHLSPADTLQFYDRNGTLLATGTTVLAAGQVYTISAKVGTGSNAAWEVRINGNVELSGTGNLGANNNGSLKLGGNSPYTTTYYYDDVAVNSQGYPGTLPTGMVQFAIDGTAFGSPVALSGGSATSASTSTLTAGSHTITASYLGDATFAASTGSFTQTISSQAAGSSTAVSSSLNPSTVGQSVTFTATVTGGAAGTPTGSVTFLDGGTPLGQGTLSGTGGTATATFTTSGLTIGTHTITASYGGDGSFAASTSSALSQTVAKANTTTTLVSSANPSTVGQGVTFTATVSGSGSGTPTGSVTFLDGNTPLGQGTLSGNGGTATVSFTTSSLGAGSHIITASYAGDSNFNGSTSAALTQTVGNGTTASTTTTVTSSANPQTAGQPVSWTATVAAAGAVNLVNFETGDFSQAATRTGGAIVTSPALDGAFSLQLQRANSVANYEIRQSGTTYYNLPTAYYSFLFEYTSNPGEGGIVNFQDTGSGFKAGLHLSPSDTLQFYDRNGTLLATGTTVLAAGQVYTISAKVGTGSNAAWEVRLNGNVELSGTGNLGANNNGSLKLGGNSPYTTTYYYDDVAVNSQGYPGAIPTGSVQFLVDGATFGAPVALSGGSATSASTSTLTPGSHTITASYLGDSTFAPSSGSFTQTINGQTTSIPDGTILVVSSPLAGQPTAPTGIIGINPTTGAQTVVSTGGFFSLPETIRQGPNQQLYVADYSSSRTGAIIQYDPVSRQQSVLAKGGNINGPDALAVVNGFLYVANTGGISGGVPNLVEINLGNGQQRLVSSGGNFSTPVSLAPAPNNKVYWADEYAFGGTGAIFAVDLQTGVQTVVTQGGSLDHMIDIGLDASGNIIVINAGSSTNSPSVLQVNPQDGTQTVISSGGILIGLDGGTVDVAHDGTIYISALASGSLTSRILAIDPTTAAQRTVTSGGNLSLVAGLVVFSTAGGGGRAAPAVNAPLSDPSGRTPSSLLSIQTVAVNSNPVSGETVASSVPVHSSPEAQPVQNPSAPLSFAAVAEAANETSRSTTTDQGPLSTAAVDSLFVDWDGSLSY